MSRRNRSSFLIITSLLSGLLLWLSWPERGITPLIFISWVPLLFAEHASSSQIRRRPGLKMFGIFFLSMVTWNTLTTWWIYNASDVGSVVAILFNSLMMTLPWQFFYMIKKRHDAAAGYISLVLFWIAFEYLHFNWEISWPWLTLGNVFSTRPEWVQWYEYTGALGGTLWILVVNLMIFHLLKNIWYKDLLLRIRKFNVLILSSMIFVVLTGPLIFSLYVYHDKKDIGDPVEVVVLQPNVDPYNEKFTGTGLDQLRAMLRLASTVIDSNTGYCIAPETALPDGILEETMENDPSILMIKDAIRQYPQLNMIAGLTSYRSFREGDKIPVTARKSQNANTYFDIYNSAMLVNAGNKVQVYHKSKLVPGVEKMPYPKLFGFLENYALELGGTSGSLGMQEHRTNLVSNDRTLIAPAICYESVYGDFLCGYIRDTAGFIVVITNDGWWGDTPGYRQHMHYARLRAVEFRKSIARSANTGISCFINQRGDVMQRTGWWSEETLKETIYKNDIITFYARHGDYIGFACAFFAVTLIIYLAVRRLIQWF